MAEHVKHHAPATLVMIDVINHFEFPDGSRLLRNAQRIVAPLTRLKEHASRAGIPVIYVNDNFGQWQSDVGRLLAYCLSPTCEGRDFVRPLQPGPEDYCVLKPMHSAFYQTPLDVLLRHLGVSSLVLAGLATNSCVLCTAHDARMRDYDVTVVSDCCAARTASEHTQAIKHIQAMAGARIVTSHGVHFDSLKKRNDGKPRKRRGDGR